MASRDYSFLDIAVLDGVRSRFAAGDAMAVLSTDLQEVIWANGPGAALFGHGDVEEIMGADARLPLIARRQIMAAPGYPDLGQDRPITVRLASGMTSRVVAFVASRLTLPGGETAILLAVPVLNGSSRSEHEMAERAIGGFRGAGHYAALIDGQGRAVAASEGFSGLGLADTTLATLVEEVRSAPDRLVKRLVRARGTSLPAGMARLADEPLLALLLVIGEDHSEKTTPAPARTSATAKEPRTDTVAQEALKPLTSETADVAKAEHDHWYFSAGEEQSGPAAETPIADQSRPTPPSEIPSRDATPKDADAPQTDRGSAPVRFVWRTDAEGRFSVISEEFAKVVGTAAADVIGRKFSDVAMIFGFDSDKDIAGLLERRDTWSGRSVLWPVAGTALRIPVDLAALPTYGRNREFEGFRGFGVARPADAVADPEGIGRSLTQDYRPPTSKPPADGTDGAQATPPAADASAERSGASVDEASAQVVTPKQERQQSDKIIRLAEHRAPANDRGLTPVERNAFREIGDRLRRESAGGLSDDKADIPDSRNEGPSAVQKSGESAAERDDDDAAVDAPTGTHAESPAPPAPDVSTGDAETMPEPAEPPSRPAVDTTILDKLPVPVLIHSGDILHYANRDFFEFTAYASIEELAERGGLDALFGDPYRDEADSDRNDRKLRLRRGDGLELPVEARLQSVPWKGGKALLLALRKVGRMPVLTPAPGLSIEQKLELESRITELSTIIDTATDGVVLIANDGIIRSISRPAEALFGVDSAEVAGKPFTGLFAIESQRAARDYLNGLSENGVASVLNDGREVIGREAQGRFIPLFMTIGKLPNLAGYCAVLRDITQWKRAEEELTQSRTKAERASSQKTDFLARVSHEIRTPLNAIIGFSELMMDEKFGPIGNDRYRDYLRDINRSGNHVLDLVNDLLDISKIEAGEQEMTYEAVSLNDTLAETVAMMQPQANRERVIIRSSFASRLPEVVADLRSVRQIALNLLSNAVRYTQAGGQVIVSTSYEASGDVVMRVRDTGIGMTTAEIEQALKPFKQINALKRARGDGTGLGLPLTKAMIEANRAKFTISSTPGEGTLVEVTFPSTRVLAG
ncbi:ATP-binding protein [Mesorhizobium sp. 1B3]|uniref:ATP-binding protein n=1 Tax=Mesorhizobium sp. 1B3 TaxID=3243599 RepID=UPI003D977BC5